jgi:hypothetical protein
MKINHVLTSVNNDKYYYEFIPIFINSWKHFFPNINITIILIGEEIPTNLQYFSNNLIIVHPLENIKTSFQAQCIRLLYPAILNEKDGILITDVDMIPLSKEYFEHSIKNLSENAFISYRDVMNRYKQVAICYNIANSITWSNLFEIKNIDDIYLKLKDWSSFKNEKWQTDQLILYRTLKNKKNIDWICLNDKITNFSRFDREEHAKILETNNNKLLYQLLKNNSFSDFHMPRPFKENKKIIKKIFNFYKTKNKLILITGASSNHYKSLIQFIGTIVKNIKEEHVIIYDLGLSEEEVATIKEICNINNFIFKKFKYNKYPSFFNIDIEAGQYAWKPTIIKNVSDKYEGIILWLDAGSMLKNNLADMIKFVNENYIYTPVSQGVITKWTHQKTLEYLNVDNKYFNRRNVSGGIIAFDNRIDWIKELIGKWQKYSTIKEYIAPKGSDRSNHRQDQSILTILIHEYKDKYNFKIANKYLGMIPHCDID